MRGEQAIFNLEIKKKSGLSINKTSKAEIPEQRIPQVFLCS